ncbi:MAG: hypothetical protein PF518_11620 [Spirochaetaceae bacterium]|jgi:predicted permease|nr:hypothetical protein [Spirochaetaceae bacterium]
MITLIKPLLIVFISLALGYAFGRIYRTKDSNIKKIRIILQRIALLGINPIAFLGAIWISPIRDLRIISLPIIGGIAIISGGILAFIYSRIRKFGRKQTGSLIPSGAFTNMGSIGGIVVYFFLGEAGFSLVPLYKFFEELLYYGAGFPIAKSFSDQKGVRGNPLKELIKDPFIRTMFSAITIGLILNFTGIPRPSWYADLNQGLIPLATVLLLFSIGLAIRFTSLKKYIEQAIVIAIIKSLLVPSIAFSLAILLNLGNMENGIALKVVLILSAMPAGFISLVPPTIYNLDLDLSNAAWIASMLSLLYSIPLLGLLLSFIGN